MYKPDHVIVRKIKEYDPHLFVIWNEQKKYFEIWREMAHGRRLITPVTQSIYDSKGAIVFAPLDERVLWWLYDADSWKRGGSKQHALESDLRWQEWVKKTDRKQREHWRDMAKDIYSLATGFYTTKYASKNSGKPTFNKEKRAQWSRPDMGSRTSNRIFARSRANALKYGFNR